MDINALKSWVPRNPGEAALVFLLWPTIWMVVRKENPLIGIIAETMFVVFSFGAALLFFVLLKAVFLRFKACVRWKRISSIPRERTVKLIKGVTEAERVVLQCFIRHGVRIKTKLDLWEYLSEVSENSSFDPGGFVLAIDSLCSHRWLVKFSDGFNMDRERFEHLSAFPELIGLKTVPRGPYAP